MPSVDQASRIVAKLVGQQAESVTPYVAPHGGDASFCYRCQLSGREALLKINKAQHQPVGAYYHRRLVEAGVPVPELIAFSSGGGPAGQGCALFGWVEGTPAEFDSRKRPPYDEAELGSILRTIHDVPHQVGFGHLDDNGRAPYSSWREALVASWCLDECVHRGALDATLCERLRALPDRFAEGLATARTGLIHCEDIMHNGNLVVARDRRIAAVLDFAGAMAGDPMWELMWFDYYFGEYGWFPRTRASFNLPRFRRAYGIEYDPRSPLQRLYLLGALLQKLSWLPLDSRRAAHHQSMLRELVDQLDSFV